MDISSILFVLALAIPTFLYIINPILVNYGSDPDRDRIDALNLLFLKKESLLVAITELENDYTQELMSTEVFSGYRADLMQQAAQVFEKIKELEGINADEEVEKLIESYRSQVHTTSTQLLCSKCGNPIQIGDLFCAKCGQKVAHTQ